MADDDSIDEPTEEIERDGASRAPVAVAPFLTAGAKIRDGRYVLERLIGRGGMAAVWLARDERLGREVAVKVLSDTLAGDEDYLERFRREARVAASLGHPNLVDVYDFGAAGGRPCLVMEYVPGGDLGERLRAGEAPEPGRLAAELLDALHHIHGVGVLHRDVKPQNVLLDREGHARLTDFGIARPRDATALTQTGQVLGTARYMAPEVLDGEAPSERADLYSLGMVLSETTDQRPAGADLDALIGRLRARDPGARPQSAAAALRLLDQPPEPIGPPTAPLTAPTERLAPADRVAVDPARTPTPPAPPPAPPAEADEGGRLGGDPRKPLAAIAAILLVVLAVVLIAGASDDGGDGGSPRASAQGDQSQSDGGGEQPADSGAGAEASEPAPEPALADGAALNDEGKALIDAGRPGDAIPVLEQAVDALADGGDQLTYGYALFNLANAYRLSGQPDKAIPLLEQRLEIPDQIPEVRQELAAAIAEAGGESSGEGSSGEGSGNGGVGPPFGEARGHDDD